MLHCANNQDIKLCRDCCNQSQYCWFNIEKENTRVGKIRSSIEKDRMTIFSITVFPEYERQGIAKETIRLLKNKYSEIIADRVRPKAKQFWEKMNFNESQGGNYIWTGEKYDTNDSHRIISK